MPIDRQAEPALRQLMAKRPCVVLTGCRQTGKTFLARRLVGEGRIVSLDLPRDAEQAESSGEAFLARHGTPLCVDEVQYAPALFAHVKRAVDARRDVPGQYLLTGSQPFALMQGVTESLAGRAAVVQLLPLSLDEIASSGRPIEREALLDVAFRGAFPELHERDLDPVEFYASYVATYLERDVRSLVAVRSLRDFDRFLRLVALRAGRLLDIGNLASETGVAVNTAKSWLSVLEASGVLFFVTPWFENLGKRLVKMPKVYFVDTGLLCSLLALETPRALSRSQLVGSVFENLVYLEIVKAYANQGRSRPIHFYRDHAGLEVDFVVPEAERLHLVEVKLADRPDVPTAFDKLAAIVGPERIASRTLVTSGSARIEKNGTVIRGPAGGEWFAG